MYWYYTVGYVKICKLFLGRNANFRLVGAVKGKVSLLVVGLQEVNVTHVLGVLVLSGILFLDGNVSLCVTCVLSLLRSV